MTLINLTDEQIGLIKHLAQGLPAYVVREQALTSLTNALDDTDSVLFAITPDDVESVANDSDEAYSRDDIDEAIKVISHGNIDFDWYDTVHDVLDNVKNF